MANGALHQCFVRHLPDRIAERGEARASSGSVERLMVDLWPRGLRRFIVVLLAVFVAKQLVIAFVSPPFTGHDEVAHFQGIRIVATEQRVRRSGPTSCLVISTSTARTRSSGATATARRSTPRSIRRSITSTDLEA